MPIDRIELGFKCRRVRSEILNLTLDQAAERTGIDKARLEAVESGRVEPSGDEVLIIADVYGEPVEFFITNERSASIEKASNLYRMYGNTFAVRAARKLDQYAAQKVDHLRAFILCGSDRATVSLIPPSASSRQREPAWAGERPLLRPRVFLDT